MSNISKICKRWIYDQIQLFLDPLLSKYQCGFRSGYNAQRCLKSLIEKWKKSVGNGDVFGSLLTDLSKAFDCLSHDFLIDKPDAYVFDKSSLKWIHSYVSNITQRIKINDRYNSWREILFKFHKDNFCSAFSYVICFTFLRTFKLRIIQTTLHHVVRVKGPNLLSIT